MFEFYLKLSVGFILHVVWLFSPYIYKGIKRPFKNELVVLTVIERKANSWVKDCLSHWLEQVY